MLLIWWAPAASGQQAPVGYDDTPMQPNGKWHVHDGNRPQPPVVVPGVTNETPVPAPADAVILLGSADDLSAWQMTDGSAATWRMKGGVLETGRGMLQTKQEFTSFQLHVEFATPADVKGNSQQRGNSEDQVAAQCIHGRSMQHRLQSALNIVASGWNGRGA